MSPIDVLGVIRPRGWNDLSRRDRLWAFAAVVVGLLVLAMTGYLAFWIVGPMGWDFGQDYRFHREVGIRFVSDGIYYLPRQLEGRWSILLMVDVLYPPPALFLFVPFAIIPEPISAILWWAIPAVVTLGIIRSFRPTPRAWFFMGVLMLYPHAIGSYLFGNTDIWAVAGLAAGFRWHRPAVLLLIKPTIAPFALIGFRHRDWWIALMALGLASTLLLPYWLAYFRAISNLELDPDYSLGSIPLLFVPVVAWLGRRSAVGTSAPSAEPFPPAS